MNALNKAIDAYINAIKYHGQLAQADARAAVLMEVSNLQADPQDRKRLIAFVDTRLKEAFS